VTGRADRAAGLDRLADALEAVAVAVGRSVSTLTIVMVAVTAVVVVLRKFFGVGWIWLQESITWMHAAVFMLAAAYTLAREEHVRVDVFYREMSPRARAWIDLVGTTTLLLPFCVFLAWTSWDYVSSSWGVGEGSRESGGLPALYLLKSVIVVMPCLLGLQGIALASRSAATLLRGRDRP
jgi:TRAP-type mannitol/chloroaromatic compound transport system permease small subunit